MKRHLPAVRRHATDLWCFTKYVVKRFNGDGCYLGAGALSYTTLVSMVPLVAIALALFSAFPIFADARDKLLELLFNILVPEVGEEAKWWFTYFAASAAHTTALGVVALAITAVLLLATIEDQLHLIWRVTTPRPWLQRVLVYWTLLTLGPVLVGASLSLSGYFDRLAETAGFDVAKIAQVKEAWFYSISSLMPFFIETIAFTLVFCLVPATKVRWREAAIGAVVAALLIEVLKIGFAYYIANWASYRNVYGALAAIPIFLLWMYISWGAVLFGAVVTAALPQWRIDEGMPRVPHEGRQLGLSLAIMAELNAEARRGGRANVAALAQRLGVRASAIEEQLGPLERAGFVAPTNDEAWVLARAPASATVYDLYKALDLPLAGGWRGREAEAPWQKRIAPAMNRVSAAESAALRLPLSQFIDDGAPQEGGGVQPVPLPRRG